MGLWFLEDGDEWQHLVRFERGTGGGAGAGEGAALRTVADGVGLGRDVEAWLRLPEARGGGGDGRARVMMARNIRMKHEDGWFCVATTRAVRPSRVAPRPREVRRGGRRER